MCELHDRRAELGGTSLPSFTPLFVEEDRRDFTHLFGPRRREGWAGSFTHTCISLLLLHETELYIPAQHLPACSCLPPDELGRETLGSLRGGSGGSGRAGRKEGWAAPPSFLKKKELPPSPPPPPPWQLKGEEKFKCHAPHGIASSHPPPDLLSPHQMLFLPTPHTPHTPHTHGREEVINIQAALAGKENFPLPSLLQHA